MTATAQKILYISPSTSFYGSERSLLEFIDCLDRTRYTPVVALPPCPHIQRYLDHDVEVHLVDVIPARWLTQIWKVVAVNAALIRLVRKERIALVHVNLLPPALEPLIGFFAYVKLTRVPLIFHLRMYYQYSAVERLILFMGRVICVSESVRKTLLAPRRSDRLTRASPDKVVTIHDGRILSAYYTKDQVEDLRREFRLNGEQVVGMVGAIERVKRTDLFLRVAREVKARHPHVKFLVVGDVWVNQPERLHYKREVMQLSRDLGLEQDVLFIGYREDVPRLLKLMDVCVLTSRREALGNVLVEAMASGKPIVSTAVDGTVEVVEEGRTGFLIRSDNPEEYAEKIILLLQDRGRRTKMGAAGMKRATELFDRTKLILKTESLYAQLLRTNHAAG